MRIKLVWRFRLKSRNKTHLWMPGTPYSSQSLNSARRMKTSAGKLGPRFGSIRRDSFFRLEPGNAIEQRLSYRRVGHDLRRIVVQRANDRVVRLDFRREESIPRGEDTFAFRTREGAMGLLQIEAAEKEAGKLTIRYRFERRD
jgi:hypothetical protein